MSDDIQDVIDNLKPPEPRSLSSYEIQQAAVAVGKSLQCEALAGDAVLIPKNWEGIYFNGQQWIPLMSRPEPPLSG